MATALKNLSEYNKANIPKAKDMKFGIVVAEWNDEITFALRDGAIEALLDNGAEKDNVSVLHVPGSIELTKGALIMANDEPELDAIICIGCVIRGDTPHFDYVCQSVTHGITELNLNTYQPIIFGVLTTENLQQAKDRAGGKHGNKGVEAAITAIKMVSLRKNK